MGIGALFGDPVGGLLFGGVWRLILSYHVTFSINSLAHWIGSQPYSRTGTARDSAFVALVTMGEGYHNYHHTFPGDYRNGVRYFDIDPPKWVLNVLARLGVVRGLKRTPGYLIALRRVRADQARLAERKLSGADRLVAERRGQALRSALSRWSEAGRVWAGGHADAAAVRARRREFWRTYRAWQSWVGS